MEIVPRPRRLCSEIQLFDLCDLETCSCKDGRFCTNVEVLERFEAIKEEDERTDPRYLAGDEYEEDEGEDGLDEMEFDGDEYEEDDL